MLKSLADFSDKILLKTILDNLSDKSLKQLLGLLEQKKLKQAGNFIVQKIPSLVQKLKNESQKQLKVVYQVQQNG